MLDGGLATSHAIMTMSAVARRFAQSLISALAAIVFEMTVIQAVSASPTKAVQGAVFVVVCMQGVFTLLASLFGHLWLKSVWLVRGVLHERKAALQRIARVVASLPPRQRYGVVRCVTVLQGGVRRLQAQHQLERRVIARAFEGTMRERRLLTNLVHGLVLLYLGMCLFVIATYGASVSGGVRCRWRGASLPCAVCHHVSACVRLPQA